MRVQTVEGQGCARVPLLRDAPAAGKLESVDLEAPQLQSDRRMSGPAVFLRNRPGVFASRLEGYGQSNKKWTCRKCRAWHDAPKPKRCQVCQHADFLHYDSAGEARWFVGLMRELDRGDIAELQHHPRFPITIEGPQGPVRVCEYVADGEFIRKGVLITGDFKPKAKQGLDPTFLLKQKLFEAQYGRLITIYTER